ncbi:MAG: PIN domain nuclease [Tessaracoccus sp.]|uniref:type II toxin-antitoxin system VapC family toxin n=1 Tax=Tessaracoccus sp. TaxID=1971211 RepID=UPI001EC3BC46|nr:PIN domain nuclease [Tessaracoccus sp.]MBK7820654.1 PIN domain nuclease [Tessaracoccus sp.]
MIVDTSVWIEFLRPGPSPAGDHLERMIRNGDPIAVPETVLMELLSGTTDENQARERQRMLEAFDIVPTVPVSDSLLAASLQRACRRAGDTVRNLGDCQIAAVALRLDVPVLHRDRDFDVLARHTGLRTVSLN